MFKTLADDDNIFGHQVILTQIRTCVTEKFISLKKQWVQVSSFASWWVISESILITCSVYVFSCNSTLVHLRSTDIKLTRKSCVTARGLPRQCSSPLPLCSSPERTWDQRRGYSPWKGSGTRGQGVGEPLGDETNWRHYLPSYFVRGR